MTLKADEYFFSLQSGFSLKISTRAGVTLDDAINHSEQAIISVFSNNPHQETLDSEAANSLVQSLIQEAISIYSQQQFLLFSQPIHFQHTLPPPPPLIQVQSFEPGTEQRSLSSRSSGGHKSYIDSKTRKRKFPCSYPSCGQEFQEEHKRSSHHKTHFEASFLGSLDKNKSQKVSCPLHCGIQLVATFSVIMSHISRKHSN
ncbi:hypothetical protein [Endozoicomonas numazuensis]|uniref:hypothetical protein n=1 Tax=Endozoicomonas numazuensis TaxID=1137799 RepID=UPI00126883D5|nr:hypothetical protein [Endozoicomonas numazuensis]